MSKSLWDGAEQTQGALDRCPRVTQGIRDAVDASKVRVYRGLKRFVNGGVQFDDGHADVFDTVIMATGYRPSLQFVAHELEFDSQGRPKVDKYWRSLGNPNLFCVGFYYPATAGWLQTIGRVARTAVESIEGSR